MSSNKEETKEVKKDSYATMCIHNGYQTEEWHAQPVVVPIVTSSTFCRPNADINNGFIYTRLGNPTRHALEKLLASMEYAEYALAYSSGMAAIKAVFEMLCPNDVIVSTYDVYGGTYSLLKNCNDKHNIKVVPVDFTNMDSVEKALIYCESPSNPMINITDMDRLVEIVKKHSPETLLVMDNTFLSPYFSNPIKHGFDIVVHSITKYINGHSDVVMGCIMTNNADIYTKMKGSQTITGGTPSPFDCYLVMRGIRTFSVRMERINENAHKVATFLASHPKIEKVLYAGLESHSQYAIHKKQSTGSAGMISIYVKGTDAEVVSFLQKLKTFYLAVSLGGYESMIQIP